jgi:hypothetical protein
MTVRNALIQQGFSVVPSDPRRFSIRVHGSVAAIQRAFQTELDIKRSDDGAGQTIAPYEK